MSMSNFYAARRFADGGSSASIERQLMASIPSSLHNGKTSLASSWFPLRGWESHDQAIGDDYRLNFIKSSPHQNYIIIGSFVQDQEVCHCGNLLWSSLKSHIELNCP